MTEEKKVLCMYEKISSVIKHPNADRLAIVTVLGYKMIVNPTMFGETMDTINNLVGLTGVFLLPDAVIPKNLENDEAFDYLKPTHMGKRVKTIKLQKEYSQGIFLSDKTMNRMIEKYNLDFKLTDLQIGDDVTSKLGILKYYALEDNEGYVKRDNPYLKPFPEKFPKTDQPHLRTKIYLLESLVKRNIVATLKVDGQSATYFYNSKDKQGGVCSRNFLVLPFESKETTSESQFFVIERQYRILDKLEKYCTETGRNLAIQGELYGKGINGNRVKLNALDFAVFDIYEWSETKNGYLNFSEVIELCKLLEIPHVPIVKLPNTFSNIDEWSRFVESLTYDVLSPQKGLPAEGIVIKTCDSQEPYFSCKVISLKFLEKYGL